MITFRELRKQCARYDEIEIRVNIAKMAAKNTSNGTNSAVKDNSDKVAKLEAKMDAIQFKVSKHTTNVEYD